MISCVVCEAVFGVQFRQRTGVLSLAFQRFYAMLVKHAIHSWRNRAVTVVQLLLPAIFTVFACVIILTVPIKETDPPPLLLSLGHFDEPEVPYTTVGAQALADSYREVADRNGRPVNVSNGKFIEILRMTSRTKRYSWFANFALLLYHAIILKDIAGLVYIVNAQFSVFSVLYKRCVYAHLYGVLLLFNTNLVNDHKDVINY